jgi:hypothetical protein
VNALEAPNPPYEAEAVIAQYLRQASPRPARGVRERSERESGPRIPYALTEVPLTPPLSPLTRGEGADRVRGWRCVSTHPCEAELLALVERLVEARERRADRGGGGAHGG